VLEESAAALIATGEYRAVKDVAPIGQPVHAATHLRNRSAPLHRQLLRVVRQTFASLP
jgi:LysR family transcriptional regulator, flagellar master operon regulator